jgi:hypothetical protein
MLLAVVVMAQEKLMMPDVNLVPEAAKYLKHVSAARAKVDGIAEDAAERVRKIVLCAAAPELRNGLIHAGNAVKPDK